MKSEVRDYFGPRYFSEGAQLPKKNTYVQDNHRRIYTMTETKICAKLLSSLITAI